MEVHLITSDEEATLTDPEPILPVVKPEVVSVKNTNRSFQEITTRIDDEIQVQPTTSSQIKNPSSNQNHHVYDSTSPETSLTVKIKDPNELNESKRASEAEKKKLKKKRLIFILNRLNSVMLLSVVPLSLLICKTC